MSGLSLSEYLYWEFVMQKCCKDNRCGWVVCAVCQNGQILHESEMETEMARCDRCTRLCCLDCVSEARGYDLLCDGCYEWNTFE